MSLTKNQQRLVELFKAFYRWDCNCGGLCHIVTDDLNLGDSSIDFCLKEVQTVKQNINDFQYNTWRFTEAELDAQRDFLLAIETVPEEERETYDDFDQYTEFAMALNEVYGYDGILDLPQESRLKLLELKCKEFLSEQAQSLLR